MFTKKMPFRIAKTHGDPLFDEGCAAHCGHRKNAFCN
jgi:hypothetical protein